MDEPADAGLDIDIDLNIDEDLACDSSLVIPPVIPVSQFPFDAIDYLMKHSNFWVDVTSAMFANHGLTMHQIENFNHFLTTMIPTIVNENKLLVVFGKKNVHAVQTVEFGQVTIPKPTIPMSNKTLRRITPAECRVRGLTYGSNIYVDVIHRVYDAKPEFVSEQHPFGKLQDCTFYKEMTICEQYPIMVGSVACYTTENRNPIANDECIHDPGGYFIINGNEKSLIGQLNKRFNFPFVFRNKSGRFSFTCEIRSWNETKYRSTSTMHAHLARSNSGTLGNIFVKLPFIEFDIPLATMFRLIGINDFNLMRLLVVGVPQTDDDFHLDYLVRTALVDVLPPSAALEDLQDYIGQQISMTMPGQHGGVIVVESKRQENKRKYVAHIVNTEFLRHIGLEKTESVQRRKAFYLGYVIRKLLLVAIGKYHPDDRDHCALKRLNDTAMLCALQYRHHYRNLTRALQSSIFKDMENGNYVTLPNLISSKRMSTSIRSAFSTGDWSTSKGTTKTMESVASALMRTTLSAALSQLRRVNSPFDKHAKAPAPRQLHNSVQGIICPNETPEGEPCGLIGAMALSGRERMGTPVDAVISRVESLPELILILKCDEKQASSAVRVFVNGNFIGITHEPVALTKKLRLMRRQANLPFDTGISYFSARNEICVNVDAGGFFRPLIALDRIGEFESIHQRYGHSPCLFWKELLIAGVIEFIDKEEEKELRIADFAHEVKQNWQEIASGNPEHPFDHLVIHPSLAFGICASSIVGSDHNQAPRNTYQSAMGKQADGIPVSNYMTRMDTKMHVLRTPEKPLVSTKTDEMLHLAEKPSGENLLVAVGVYDGYNQEDSIILNMSSVQMGMFRTTCFQTIRDQEKPQGVDRESICNPALISTKRLQKGNYFKIQPNGLPAVGSLVTYGDVYLGKIIQAGSNKKKNSTGGTTTDTRTSNGTGTGTNLSSSSNGHASGLLALSNATNPDGSSGSSVSDRAKQKLLEESMLKDISHIWHEDESAYVDRVMQSVAHKDDSRYIRVRFRTERMPEVGDKFSSRHGQKGVCGAIRRKEDMPYTHDGLVPDMIINPHAFPSRMTIAHIMEMVLGTVSCLHAERIDGTAFKNVTVGQIGDLLHQAGYQRHGNFRLYSGSTGELLKNPVFMGMIYYQRLKHQVIDKIHARATGGKQLLTRQPTEGRHKDGGLRFGEMEVDCMTAHGASAALCDRLHINSDAFNVVFCTNCGLPANRGKPRSRYRYTSNLDESSHHLCQNCALTDTVRDIRVPYGFKLFMQELYAMNIGARLKLAPVQEEHEETDQDAQSQHPQRA